MNSENDDIKDKFKKAREKLAADKESYDGIGELIEKECGTHDGPFFAPSNDIERRKVIKEIRESGDGDDE